MLTVHQSHSASPVISDRECVGCGYNLRGLAKSARCPECGLPVTPVGKIDDPLSLMPLVVIRRFVIGCWMATAAAVGVIAIVIFSPWMSLSSPLGAIRLVVLALLWLAAAWLVTPALGTPQAGYYGFSQRSYARKAGRALQFGWLIAAGAWLASALIQAQPAPATGTPAATSRQSMLHALDFITGAGALVGVAGVVIIGIMLMRLAKWARDDDAHRVLHLALWGLPALSLMLFIDLPLPIPRLGLFLVIIWTVLVAAFPYALWSLSRSLTWAVYHSREHRERVERRAQRRAKYDDEIASTVRRMDESRGRRRKKERDAAHGS